MNVYTEDKEYKKVFAYSKRMVLSKVPEKSDVILITDESMLLKIMREKPWSREGGEKPVLFVTDYRLLKVSFDVVGAFYWRKGRSQLLFIKNRLNAYNITLPEEYEDFMVDEL